MILLFYNLALLAALLLGAPWWLFRMATTHKYREGLKQRLGGVPTLEGRNNRPLIWIHAVSVGEVIAASRLVQELDAALPDYFVAVSTTTRTGQAIARERFGEGRVFYCPLDLPWAVRAYLQALQPRMLVLAETEFWPNLLSACHSRAIPVAVANARVSDRSWPRYRRLRWFWQPLLSRLTQVLAQSQTDADRLIAIGCQPLRVSVAGNLKFDVRAVQQGEATQLLRQLSAGLRVVVAGSTLDGEESTLLEAWPRLLQADPNLLLAIAPRHPERFGDVAGLLENSGLRWSKRSAWRLPLEAKQQQQPGQEIQPLQAGAIVLLDSIGELASIYSLAAVAFVGGSLVPAGGHNPLEPAQFGVPVVMGPHYANFRAIVDELRLHDAIAIVTGDQLATRIINLLSDPADAKALGARAKLVFEAQAGATARCVAAILEMLGQKHAGQAGLLSGGTLATIRNQPMQESGRVSPAGPSPTSRAKSE